jgi:probable HAF family extracellular repeat protein
MRRRSWRGIVPAALLLALITWVGCSDEDPTGPSRRDATDIETFADELTCVPVASDLVQAEVCDLGAVLGGVESFSYDVNGLGEVAVSIRDEVEGETEEFAYVWSEANGAQLLESKDWFFTRPSAINENGDVVGLGFGLPGFVGVRWPKSTGSIEVLNAPSSSWFSAYPYDINAAGEAVGSGSTTGGNRAVVWPPGSTTASALTVPGVLGSGAEAINENGVTAGWLWEAAGTQPVYWCCGAQAVVTRLGRLEGDDIAYGRGVNNADPLQIVGYGVSYTSGQTRPYLWENTDDGAPPAGTLVELPSLAGRFANAYDINDDGYAVGYAESTVDGPSHAVLWTPDGKIVDLGVPDGYEESFAWAINKDGWIAGYSQRTVIIDGDDETISSATLWRITESKTPEPPTIEELLELLRDEIRDLREEGSLNRGQARSLLVRVWLTKRWLERGRERRAIRSLQVMAWHVWVYTRVGILTRDESKPLFELIGQILGLLRTESG